MTQASPGMLGRDTQAPSVRPERDSRVEPGMESSRKKRNQMYNQGLEAGCCSGLPLPLQTSAPSVSVKVFTVRDNSDGCCQFPQLP